MDETTYTIKEIMAERFDEMEKHLIEIKNQTIKTNGRVGKLESHRSYLWGAFTMLTLLGGTIIYFAVSAIDIKIRDGISQALEANVSKVEYEK